MKFVSEKTCVPGGPIYLQSNPECAGSVLPLERAIRKLDGG